MDYAENCTQGIKNDRSVMKATISIIGLVQGVGFRPFIYNLAIKKQLTGYVSNTSDGVHTEVFGKKHHISNFIAEIKQSKPPAAEIHNIKSSYAEVSTPPPPNFIIQASIKKNSGNALLPPDMDVCPDCQKELFDPQNRRYLYPFINCTNCGPRYSIINQLPYDRPSTSMASFKLCPECEKEYNDPHDRRFHAQPNACKVCGPSLQLLDAKGIELTNSHPIEQVQNLLHDGIIIAIKGIGGFHLAVDATNNQAISRLRQRKRRPHKPLAVMAKDIATIKSFAYLSAAEEQTISSRHKPIILLRKQNNFSLSNLLSPDISHIGVMLPYTPLHHLLLHGDKQKKVPVLVMTSGNRSDEPMSTSTTDAVQQLSDIADYYLTHNRKIVNISDDSVGRVNNGQICMIRRSRAYAPVPQKVDIDAGQILAVGGVLKNCICLTKGRNFFMSQHIGDLNNLETLHHFNAVIKHLQNLLHIRPKRLIHDLHPDYPSTSYALESGVPTQAVQHHHAHAAGCMAENNITAPAIAIILDGSGLGTDNSIWGGEILIADYKKFIRAAHIAYIAQPGGDMAAREPWRMATSYLYATYGTDIFTLEHPLLSNRKEQISIITQMIDQKINSPQTSSCGRLFDCVAALLGLRETNSFEAQGAMVLEDIATIHPQEPYAYNLSKIDGVWQISFLPTIKAIIDDLSRGIAASEISTRFHATVISAFAAATQKIAHHHKIDEIVLSGGVFQNMLILNGLSDILKDMGFKVFKNKQIPANDGGLAFGQAVIGAHTWNG